MGKTLYLEGSSGIAGDMTVAALLDLGGSAEKLDAVFKSLGVGGLHYEIGRRRSCGIEGCAFDVILNDHDHCHEHDYCHEHDHHHHEHDHHHHDHEHRNFADVCAIINKGSMSDRARALAKKIFAIIADAESIAHGIPVEEVHFHEVGAVDSIADIVGAAVLIDDLEITECIVSGISEGEGFVKCQHGMIPVPVPAVVNIARRWEIPLRPTGVKGEMVTPTGIAIAAALRTAKELPEEYVIEKIGIGVGKKEFPHANILRAMLIKEEKKGAEKVWLLESNIDDCSGEVMGYAMEKLLEEGALDVHYTPCFMKKNRPGYILSVIVPGELVERAEDLIFEHTTTIGIRKRPLERSCMMREQLETATEYGMIAVKKCSWKEIVKFYPEYESVKSAAEKANVSFKQVFDAAVRSAYGSR